MAVSRSLGATAGATGTTVSPLSVSTGPMHASARADCSIGDGVASEPGIDKSRLLTDLTSRILATGWLVLSGRAYDTESRPPSLPFVPFIELRSHVLGREPEASASEYHVTAGRARRARRRRTG